MIFIIIHAIVTNILLKCFHWWEIYCKITYMLLPIEGNDLIQQLFLRIFIFTRGFFK